MSWIPWIDEDRMQFRTVRRSVLLAAAPGLPLRMRVESVDAFPGRAPVVRPEQSLRRCAGIEDARLVVMRGCQPERVIDDALAAVRECRRLLRFPPRPTGILRAEDRGAQVAGARGSEHSLRLARVRDRMVQDVTEELRSAELPSVARDVARQRPETLAGRDQNPGQSRRRLARRDGGTSH